MGPTASNAAETGLGQHTPTRVAGRACLASQASTSTSCIPGRAHPHRDVSTPSLPCGRARPAVPRTWTYPGPLLAPRSARHHVLMLALLTGTMHQHRSPYHSCLARGSAPSPATDPAASGTRRTAAGAATPERGEKKKNNPGENKVPLLCTALSSSAPASPAP